MQVNSVNPQAAYGNVAQSNNPRQEKVKKHHIQKPKTQSNKSKFEPSGITRDQKTMLKAGVAAALIGAYLVISGKGAKLIKFLKKYFDNAAQELTKV